MKNIVEQSVLDAKTIREMIFNEVKGYIENMLDKDDRDNIWEEVEIWDYIKRVNKRINEEFGDDDDENDEDYFDDNDEDDLAFKAAEAEIQNICQNYDDEEETLEQIVQRLEEDPELNDDEDDNEEPYSETYELENDDDGEEEQDISPMESKERAVNAWRKYQESKAYKPPFSSMKNVVSGGSDIKIGDQDRERLLIHAGLIQPDKTTIVEGLRFPFSIEMKRLAGVKHNHPSRLAKQLLNEWDTTNYWREKHLLNG